MMVWPPSLSALVLAPAYALAPAPALAAAYVPALALAPALALIPATDPEPPPPASPEPESPPNHAFAPGPPPGPAPAHPAPYIPPASAPELTGGFGANLSVAFAFLPSSPDMVLETPDGGAMPQFSAFPLRHLAAMEMIDLSASAFYRTASPIVVPLVGFEFGIPVSTGYPGSVALGTKPGSLTWQRGGPTFYDGLDILGLGVSFTTGTFRFTLDAMPGFRFVRSTGTITQGMLTVDAEPNDTTFSLHADVSACAGAKAAASVCVFAAPHVYEFSQWMNGAAFGVRLETN